ncbi:tRNA1(Val) (adenine(37)-N6)-methyltransferase [Desulfogranum japonicum]|uniref:tRNA1(Val) (adenine(37)-N6)-methyltransferase n=1 Tax=Desulfogranum japonicum TaxID=231447 RepID=UPI0003F90998|nr:methyltransferase [Desulfogranum japonicum]
MSKTTCDSLFNGDLLCHQHTDGYRFSIDAVLLGHYVTTTYCKGRILDLCCGCGIIGLILAYRCTDVSITGMELQVKLAGLALKNSVDNGLNDRVTIIQGDLKNISGYLDPESIQAVVCNPPYGKQQAGRINYSSEAAIARHEISATLEDCVQAASFAVQNRGRVMFIYPSSQLPFLIQVLYSKKLVPKQIQPIYSYPEASEAKLVIVDCVKNGGEQCALLPPLYIYCCKNGPYSPEVAAMYIQSEKRG